MNVLGVEELLRRKFDSALVKSLLRSYVELKENFYLGKHKPTEMEAGHFVEAVRRLVQQEETGTFTPLGKKLPVFDNKELQRLESATSLYDSFRFHIPRALKLIYQIRSKRGAGHLAGEVNPNYMDSLLVVSVCDWVMAELVRLNSEDVSPQEAQNMVDNLAKRRIPLVQEIAGYPKILDPTLNIPKQIRALLYIRSDEGASVQELQQWIKSTSKTNLLQALKRLDKSADVHFDGEHCWITEKGMRYVQENIPFELG